MDAPQKRYFLWWESGERGRIFDDFQFFKLGINWLKTRIFFISAFYFIPLRTLHFQNGSIGDADWQARVGRSIPRPDVRPSQCNFVLQHHPQGGLGDRKMA